MSDLRAHHRGATLAIAERRGACDVRVFGSFARGDATGASEVDLLVSTTERVSPTDIDESGPATGFAGHLAKPLL